MLPSVTCTSSRQCTHTRRTRRWATIPMMLPAITSGETPRSLIRWKLRSAELVCSVEKTWWPVMAARKAISAVSLSRTSPTRMMSGSWRMSERTPSEKSILLPSEMEVCRIRVMGYSTGSSSVMMLTLSSFMWLSTEYSVVVLPEPVGPVTRMMPSGRASIRSSR